jgi:hypothetical protein
LSQITPLQINYKYCRNNTEIKSNTEIRNNIEIKNNIEIRNWGYPPNAHRLCSPSNYPPPFLIFFENLNPYGIRASGYLFFSSSLYHSLAIVTN